MSATRSEMPQKRKKEPRETKAVTEEAYAASTAYALDGFDLNIAEAALERFKKRGNS